eukprot:CAMPEP_0184313900 /NCGR_PEP_ID=MMETSP1049-20130417/68896_1 /TAXON_ID=77928 /ORGANISM="Proteomonas sulcata, Strain CCMP704" /LENGTH=60 /DNA_ID=CAMNT_0026631497 /DNA_START=178 /DNA_END=360 /DNA_ORIENTATION=+
MFQVLRLTVLQEDGGAGVPEGPVVSNTSLRKQLASVEAASRTPEPTVVTLEALPLSPPSL